MSGRHVFDLVEQVGLAFAQVFVDEGAALPVQGRPGEAVAQGFGQSGLQQTGGFRGLGEDGSEEPVMGLMDVCHLLPVTQGSVSCSFR